MGLVIPGAVWAAVGGTLLSGVGSGTLPATPALGPPPLQVQLQADLLTNPTARLLVGYAGAAPAAANAVVVLGNGQSQVADLQPGTVIGWALVDSTGAALNGGANDYLRVLATQ